MLWQSNYRLLSCWANSRTLSVNPPVTQAPTLGHCHYTQPTPWCAGQPRHTLFTSFMMRLELEVLGVSQTGFLLFVCLFNLWGNWGPEQWLKQCRAREEIWDLGKGGWCVKVSFLPSFLSSLPLLFYFFPSFSFLPSLLYFFLLMNIIHSGSILRSLKRKSITGPRRESISKVGSAGWPQSQKLRNNPFPGLPTCELHKFIWICVPELDGPEDAYSFKPCSQEMDVKAGRKRHMFWPSSIWTSFLCLENSLPQEGEPTSQS